LPLNIASKHAYVSTLTKDFELGDKDFEDFINFTKGKDYNYTTETEDALQKFKDQAAKENYLSGLSSEFESLSTKLKLNKSQ
jgi:carboxyl-terminal processing protease